MVISKSNHVNPKNRQRAPFFDQDTSLPTLKAPSCLMRLSFTSSTLDSGRSTALPQKSSKFTKRSKRRKPSLERHSPSVLRHLSHLARSSHHLNKIQPLLQTSFQFFAEIAENFHHSMSLPFLVVASAILAKKVFQLGRIQHDHSYLPLSIDKKYSNHPNQKSHSFFRGSDRRCSKIQVHASP